MSRDTFRVEITSGPGWVTFTVTRNDDFYGQAVNDPAGSSQWVVKDASGAEWPETTTAAGALLDLGLSAAHVDAALRMAGWVS